MEAVVDYKNRMSVPNIQKNIWPCQSCPAFTKRKSAICGLKECWYCQYADFHLDKANALDVGICTWPDISIK